MTAATKPASAIQTGSSHPQDLPEFQFDYAGYLRNMTFLVILMGVLVYILVKLKSRGPGGLQLPGLQFLKGSPAGNSGQQVRVLERCGLEGRKNLYLVQIFENQYWLVGTTDTQITSLGPVKPPYYTGETSAVSDTTRTFSEYMEDHETTTTTD